MTSITSRAAANRIAGELAALLDTDTAWITPEWVASVLSRPTRCRDCGKPLYAARSVAAGRGPRCQAKRARRS